MNFYLENFEYIHMFDLYRFVISIFDHFTLEATPTWKFSDSHPIEVPLIKLIRFMFDYGICSV